MSDETKPWWQSIGIWGGIVAGLSGLAGMFGYAIDAALQTDITNWVAAIAAAVGGLIAIIGRIKASKTIGQ